VAASEFFLSLLWSFRLSPSQQRQDSEARAALKTLVTVLPSSSQGQVGGEKMAKAFPVLGVSILFLCLAPANALMVLAAASLIPALLLIWESF
jgi:hypothetical protein